MGKPISSLITIEAQRWAVMKITTDHSKIAKQIAAGKTMYMDVSAVTGVPWFMIGCLHIREASGNWHTQLAQGDPLNQVSRHVPKGRGPFATWKAGAIDALVNCAPKAANWHNWSAGGSLAVSNEYNGLGYWYKDVPSPYNWAGTDIYHSGKYIADGQYDPNFVDTQPGVANLIWHLQQIDSSVKFFATLDAKDAGGTGPQSPHGPVIPIHPNAAPPLVPSHAPPSISNPAPGSVGAKITDWFHALERRL